VGLHARLLAELVPWRLIQVCRVRMRRLARAAQAALSPR
jgi:hypothetical protein